MKILQLIPTLFLAPFSGPQRTAPMTRFASVVVFALLWFVLPGCAEPPAVRGARRSRPVSAASRTVARPQPAAPAIAW